MRRWSPFRISALLGFLLGLVLLACSGPQAKETLLHEAPTLTPTSPQPVGSASGPTTPVPAPSVSLCPAASPEWQCGENQVLRIHNCAPAASSTAAWACYEDLEYGFAVEYPAKWKWTVGTDTGLRSDVKVARRHEFRGVEGALDIDIWVPSDPDLVRWLKKHQEATGPDLIRIAEPNAKVGGYPAAAFVMGDVQNPSPMLAVYVSNGRYVYRLWFTLYCDPAEIPILRQILDTFRFSARTVPAEIPEDVWQEVQRAFGPPRCAPPPPTP